MSATDCVDGEPKVKKVSVVTSVLPASSSAAVAVDPSLLASNTKRIGSALAISDERVTCALITSSANEVTVPKVHTGADLST